MRLFMLAVFLLSGWGMAQSSQPSLADLSEQARERKARALKPARLITNADLECFQNAPVSVSQAAEEGEPSVETRVADPKAADLPEDGEPKRLAEWQPKFQEAVLDYKNAVNRGRVLQLRLNNMYNSAHRPDRAPHADFRGEFERATNEFEINKKEVVRAEEALEALKVAARAAGLEEARIFAMVGELPRPTSTDLETPNRTRH